MSWTPGRDDALELTEDGDLRLSTDERIGRANLWSEQGDGWSVRAQGRLEDGNVFGIGVMSENSDRWFASLGASGELNVGENLGSLASAPIGLDPTDEVIIQLDAFDGELKAWAWSPDSMLASDEPLLTVATELGDKNSPYLWTTNVINGLFDGPSSSQFRWVEYSSNHIPLTVWIDCDLDGNLICDLVDADVLTAAILAGTADLSELLDWRVHAATENGFPEPYLMGDADLDGDVDSSDLNRLALKWQGATDKWSEGDFNADGMVDAGDLNSLALNWRESIAVTASPVPEPTSSQFAWLAGAGVFLLRRRQR